jgi:hypothetical protein
MRLLKLVVLILLTELVAAQQRPLAKIQGIVLKAGSNDALSKATVRLERSDSAATPHVTTTGADGRFFFPEIEPGEYRLIATRDGYVQSEYGQRGTNGPGLPIALGAGRQLADVQIALGATGAIYGRVYDPAGKPLANAIVEASAASYQSGRRALTLVQTTRTNDLGEYRLFWLTPGSYYISALPESAERLRGMDARLLAGQFAVQGPLNPGLRTSLMDHPGATGPFAPIYFPGATDERLASPIELRAGEDVGGIEITMTPGQTRRVRGIVVNSVNGAPVQGVELLRVTNPNPSNRRMYELVDFEKGTFDIREALPGSYFLVATAGRLRGRVSIEVGDADIEDVVVTVGPGFDVPAQIRFEGSARTPGLSNFEVTLTPDPTVTGVAELQARPLSDGSLTLQNVMAGTYRVSVAIPEAFENSYVKTIRLGDVDVLNAGLNLTKPPEGRIEIILGSNAGAVEGRALEEQQQPSSNVTVVLVPDPARRSRPDLYKAVQSDVAGRFRFERLPPGDYKVFAWEDVVAGAWQNAEFMSRYEDLGRPVRIQEGGKESLDMSVIPAR